MCKELIMTCRKSCYRLIFRLRYQSLIVHSRSNLVHVYSLLYDDIYSVRMWRTGTSGVQHHRQATIMDKSLGTLAFLGRFPIHTGPTPPLTPQTMLDACIQNFFFPSFNFVQGGKRENCKKISKMINCSKMEPRNDRKICILQYCPKDFCPGLQVRFKSHFKLSTNCTIAGFECHAIQNRSK